MNPCLAYIPAGNLFNDIICTDDSKSLVLRVRNDGNQYSDAVIDAEANSRWLLLALKFVDLKEPDIMEQFRRAVLHIGNCGLIVIIAHWTIIIPNRRIVVNALFNRLVSVDKPYSSIVRCEIVVRIEHGIALPRNVFDIFLVIDRLCCHSLSLFSLSNSTRNATYISFMVTRSSRS